MQELVIIYVKKHVLITKLGELYDLSQNSNLSFIKRILPRSPLDDLFVQVNFVKAHFDYIY